MTPGNIDTLFTVMGILTVSGFSLIALKIVVGAWIRRKELGAGGTDSAKLLDAVEALRAENYEMREHLSGEIAEIQERIDFTERMLARGNAGPSSGNAPRD
jgi:hypothetical protein